MSDADGFDRLYRAYHGRLYGFLYRLAGTRPEADDLLQETWLRVARQWGRGDARNDEAAWLFTIARNVFLSARRNAGVKTRAMQELQQVPTPPGPDPEWLAQASDEARALEAALAALSEDDRALLWLVATEDLDQQQVADVLGISHAAVRQRVARARDRLAAQLARSHDRARKEQAR